MFPWTNNLSQMTLPSSCANAIHNQQTSIVHPIYLEMCLYESFQNDNDTSSWAIKGNNPPVQSLAFLHTKHMHFHFIRHINLVLCW